jgi:hypothetical protein
MRFKNPNKKWEVTTKESGPFQRLGGNRSKKYIIKNMELVAEDITENDGGDQ